MYSPTSQFATLLLDVSFYLFGSCRPSHVLRSMAEEATEWMFNTEHVDGGRAAMLVGTRAASVAVDDA